MKNINWKRVLGIALVFIVVFGLFYYASDLIVYTLLAFLVSMLGRPAVKLLHNRLKLPAGLCAMAAIVFLLAVAALLVWLIFPLFIRQVSQLADIDYNELALGATDLVNKMIAWLADRGVYITENEVNGYVMTSLSQLFEKVNLERVVGHLAGSISTLSVGIFSVVFISFFFLRDEKLFKKIIYLFVPEKYESRVENVLQPAERLLSRYFIGITAEVLCMVSLLSLGLWAMGVPNALFYGCMGGFLNIIPYLGPVIGCVLACLFSLFSSLSLGINPDMFWLLLKVIGVFVTANLVDNFLLQPAIYSTSVLAHPLEIFFVILLAGHIMGIWGMVIAIPLYTVLRIFAKEFFKETKFTKELTRRI